MEAAVAYHHYTVIRETWLTRKLDGWAVSASALSTMALILGATLYWNGTLGLDTWMAANHVQLFASHQWWRAWTTLFVHGDPRHLLSNAFMFFIVGIFLSGYFGVFVFPLLAVAVGGLLNILVLGGMPPETQLIGMSGVVFWMGGFWLTLYLLIDRRRTLTQRIVRAGGATLGLYVPAEAFDPSISYLSHLWGFIFGVAFALIYFFYNREKFNAAEVREEICEEA